MLYVLATTVQFRHQGSQNFTLFMKMVGYVQFSTWEWRNTSFGQRNSVIQRNIIIVVDSRRSPLTLAALGSNNYLAVTRR